MTRLAALLSRVAGREVGEREAWLLAGAIALGLVVRVTFVLATLDHQLAGDEPYYDEDVRLNLDGKWFWSSLPWGEPHATAWKAPGYSVFLALLYTLTDSGVDRVLMLQTLLMGPLVIFLVWLLARRLFDDGRVALIAAAISAVHPNMWQWETRLWPEALFLPIALVLYVLILGSPPTRKRAVAAGAVLGVALLVRPNAFIVLPMALVAWWAVAGFRRGVTLTAVTLGVAVLVVAPWTIRNYVVLDAFVPISIQDAAAYGTFNDTAANDPDYPYGWRAAPERDLDLRRPEARFEYSDAELREEWQSRAWEYIKDNPESVPKAFFWNGITRTWDLRRPSNMAAEAPFEGRKKSVAYAGLFIWWGLLALALVAAVRLWSSRRGLILAIGVLALGMSIVLTTLAGTRYRQPIEPLVIVLAATTLAGVLPRRAPDSKLVARA